MKPEAHLVWCSLLGIPDPSNKVQLLLDRITYFCEKCTAPNPQCLRQWLTFWRIRGFVDFNYLSVFYYLFLKKSYISPCPIKVTSIYVNIMTILVSVTSCSSHSKI